MTEAKIRCYGIQAGAWEARFVYAPTREHALKVAERWVRLFWRRYVAQTLRNHPGSIAAAINRDEPRLLVFESGLLDSASIVPSEPWTRVLDHEIVGDTTECESCKRRPGEVNHPVGMIFVGWGRGWETCSVCNGTTRRAVTP